MLALQALATAISSVAQKSAARHRQVGLSRREHILRLQLTSEQASEHAESKCSKMNNNSKLRKYI